MSPGASLSPGRSVSGVNDILRNVAALTGLTALEVVQCWNLRANRVAKLGALTGLASLKLLHCAGGRLDTAAWGALGDGLRHGLKELDLIGTVDARAFNLSVLLGFTRLQRLGIATGRSIEASVPNGGQLRAPDSGPLGLPALQALNLGREPLSVFRFDPQRLRELAITCDSARRDAAKALLHPLLVGLTKLTLLDYWGSLAGFCHDFLPRLARLPTLHTLVLCNVGRVIDEGYAPLAVLPALQHIVFRHHSLAATQAVRQQLAALPRLQIGFEDEDAAW